MKLIIGSDRSGFSLKEAVKSHLEVKGYNLIDVGVKDIEEFIPFYEVAPRAAEKLIKGEAEKAILFCGTGAGMAIVANKYKGIYAVVVESIYTAKMSRIINNANVLTMGGWVVAPNMAIEIVDIWLSTDFTQGMPEDRAEFLRGAYQEVRNIEAVTMK